MDENKKYRKFKLSIIIITFVLVSMLAMNFFFTIKTPFSGTTYLQLPSNFYITQSIPAKLIKSNFNVNQINESDILNYSEKLNSSIPPGSFILAVNGNFIDTKIFKDRNSAIEAITKLLKLSPEKTMITVLIPNTYPQIEEMSGPEYFRKYSKEYEINTNEVYINFGNDSHFLGEQESTEIKQEGIKKITILQEGIFLGFLADGGATDRAGIKTGDILLSVDGVKWKVVMSKIENGYFLDYNSLYKLRTQPTGKPLNYKILRGNEIFDIKVQLATFGIPLKLLVYFLIGLLFIAVGWLYAFFHPQYIGSRLSGLWLILLGFVIGTQMQIIPLEFKIYGIIFTMLKESVALITLPIVLHSFTYFPTEIKEISSKKWIHLTLYAFFLIQIILFSVTYLAEIRVFSSLIFGLITLAAIIFYVIVRIIFRKNYDKKYKGIGKWVLTYFISVLFIGNIPTIIPITDSNILNIFWYVNIITTSLIPILYLFIAWKFRIYDITVKMKKNLQYYILTIFWLISMSAIAVYSIWSLSQLNFSFLNIKLIGSNIEFFSGKNGLDANTGFEKFLFLLISVLIIFIVYKLTKAIQKILDEKFYRQKFDYKKSQNELIKLIQTNFKLHDLAGIIVEKLSVLVHLKRVATVFYGKKGNSEDISPEAIYCFDSKLGNEFCYLIDTRLYDIFNSFETIVSVERLPDWGHDTFSKNGIHFIIPIKSKHSLLGMIFIGEKLSESAMTKEDFDFINSITSHISVAIENALLYEELAKQERIRHELELARSIQLASLPHTLPHIKGLDVSGVSIPAHEVGGDFYDFFNGNGNNLTVVVGDVSGKGTSAALYMSKIQGIFRTLNEFKLNPKDLLIRANRLLYKNIESNSFITAIGANFDFNKKELLLSRAGHLPLIKFNNLSSKIEYLQTPGIGLGLANEDVFANSIDEIRFKFEKGDIFFFLSDGLSEARNTQMEEFGLDRLTKIIKENSMKSSKYICDEIIKEVKKFAGETGQFDDITAVVVKIID